MSKVQLNIWVEEDEREMIKETANQLGLSAGRLVVTAVRAFDGEIPSMAGRYADHERRLLRLEAAVGIE